MMRRLIGRGARPWGPRGTAAATIAARLTFRDVTHRYEGVGGVTGVDLDVAPGGGKFADGRDRIQRQAQGVGQLSQRRPEAVLQVLGPELLERARRLAEAHHVERQLR